MSWYVYMVSCSDDSVYTGISKNPTRRLKEHNCGSKGSKYTRSRRPVKLVYVSNLMNQSNALKEERRIKKLTKDKKLELITSESNCI